VDALIARVDSAVLSLLADVEAAQFHAFGEVSTFRAVHDRTYRNPSASESSFQEEGPTLLVRLSDLHVEPDEDPEARVWIGAQSYQIRETRPDGKGVAVLVLGRVEP